MKKIFQIAIFLTLLALRAKAQVPSNDSAWVLQTYQSDEFDSSAVRTYKWQTNTTNPVFINSQWVGLSNGAELNFTSNLISNSSTLKIKADTLSPAWTVMDTSKLYYGYSVKDTTDYKHPLNFSYSGGTIISKNVDYKYGYFEIYAKYPSKKFSLWPAFWLWSGCYGGMKYYNEIDIAEVAAWQSYLGNQVLQNNYVTLDTCTNAYTDYITQNTDTVPVDSLSGAFHKFALQWDPDKITFYFDDEPTLRLEDTSGLSIPQNPMSVQLNFCVDPWHAYLDSSWRGVIPYVAPFGQSPRSWPQYLEVDYFHYYKLGATCSTDLLTLCTPAGYDRKVKRKIATDNTCSPTFNPSTSSASYTLRATDYVILDAGTTIDPSGTGYFAIEILTCPQ